jgi:hypothetical protein
MTPEKISKLSALNERETKLRANMNAEMDARDAAPADSITHVEAHARATLLYKQLLQVVREKSTLLDV